MYKSRRQFIRKIVLLGSYGLALSSSFFYSSIVKAQWLKYNFRASPYDDVLTDLFGNVDFVDSHKINFSGLPNIAENGAIVPVTIKCRLKNVDKISILVKDNPHPLIAEFHLTPAIEPQVSARIKMAKTSEVIVIVESEGKFYRKAKAVKVAVGGCG